MRFIIDGVLAGAVAMHVDAIVFEGAGSVSKKVVEVLNDMMPTKHLEELKWYRGIEQIRDRKARTIGTPQTSYHRSVLECFGFSRTTYIPTFPSMHLGALKEDDNTEAVPFREMVRGLMWIVNQIRSDITNIPRAEARQSHNPKENQWRAAQRIVSYRRATEHIE